jgi:NADH:ubiquinone reductase (H+-translocating)
VANTIKARLPGETAFRAFRYKHAGSLAQIGKRRAVIAINWLWIHTRNQRSARLITQGRGRSDRPSAA